MAWPPSRRVLWIAGGLTLVVAAGLGAWFRWPWAGAASEVIAADPAPSEQGRPTGSPYVVRVGAEQQNALGLETARVELGKVDAVLGAPGQVIPDESRYAYITPRARGIVRSVSAQIGQYVEVGTLLATIDSEQVAQARLDLIDALLRLEIARAKLSWQESIYRNALDMIEALQEGRKPEQIQVEFADRPIGQTREQLLKAYAQFFLSRIEARRYENLQEKEAVSVALAQQKQAQLQVDQATFQGLMDRMTFEVTLDYTLARQALREARTSVKVARETLRVLGASIDEIVRRFESGELTGDEPARDPGETIREAAESASSPSREVSGLMEAEGEPVSTYEIRAPFGGTILERERIVPGVVVDGTHHLFTMSDLETVWVEAHVHESDFDLLKRSREGRVEFTSPAYPDRAFTGRVLYTGDMVDPKSRTVRLLATARNPDRMLKPGMFVDVEIHSAEARELPKIPESALLTDDDRYFVFVRIGPERFERRRVRVGDRHAGAAAIPEGLEPGEEVVVRGAFELKSKLQSAPERAVAGSARRSDEAPGG